MPVDVDVLLLAQKFLERFAASAGKEVLSLSGPVAAQLLAYSWPGNVRELSNCIERAVALAQYSELVLEDLPERVRAHKQVSWAVETDDPARLESMEEIERRYIQRVLDAVKGSKAAAARILGFDRTTLYRKLERYGLGGERDSG